MHMGGEKHRRIATVDRRLQSQDTSGSVPEALDRSRPAGHQTARRCQEKQLTGNGLRLRHGGGRWSARGQVVGEDLIRSTESRDTDNTADHRMPSIETERAFIVCLSVLYMAS